jgi:hypothetical protein
MRTFLALVLLGLTFASLACEAKVSDKDNEHGAAVKVDTK